MAKKVRTKPEESPEPAFEFPVFDEIAFVRHELELTYGMAFVVVLAIVAGILSALLTAATAPVAGAGLPILVGLAFVIATPIVYPRVRPAGRDYTRTDWAGLIALELFAWLGVWFLVAAALGSA
jgi:hypothetical protein